MAYGNQKATFGADGHIIYETYRIKRIQQEDTKSGTKAIYEVDLGKRSGKYVRKRFSGAKHTNPLKWAKDYAQRMRQEADRDGIIARNFSEAQRADAVIALNVLEAFDGVNLQTAAEYFEKHNRIVDHTSSTDALIGEYLKQQADKLEKGNLRQRSYNECETRLAGFRNDNGHRSVDTITGKDIDRWLDEKGFPPTSRANYRRYIGGFFRWAMKQDHIESNPIEKTQTIKKKSKTPQVYTAKQAHKIMATAVKFAAEPVVRFKGSEHQEVYRTEIIPYLAIGFFAGLRPEEIQRLHWRDIDFSDNTISVNTDASKTGRERIVDMTKALASWLAPHRRKKSDKVFPLSITSLTRWRQEVFKQSEIQHIQDGARHSFATMYLADHSETDTAHEMGNSEAVIREHYKGVAKKRKAQASEYFSICPQKEDTIIPFKEGAA